MRRLGLAVVGAIGLVLLELMVVLLVRQRHLAGIWEISFGTLWLAPVLVLGAALGGALGAVLWQLAALGDGARPRALLALVSAGCGGALAWGVGGGRHLASLPTRGGFALVVGAVAAAAAWLAAPRLGWAIRRHPTAVAVGSAAVALAAELGNRWLLVRLYPVFHLGLALTALVAAAGVTLPWFGPAARPRRAAWPWVVLVTALVGAAGAAKPHAERLARFDNFRLVLLESGPLVGQGVRLAAALAPPPPIAIGGCEPGSCGDAERPAAGRSIDWRDRDLLLVTVDAMRADHVGAYGYARRTTPNLDALAASGAWFTHAYAPTPHTSYSVTSLMTGKYMRPLLLQGAGADSDTWASLLRTYSFRTAAFYPPAVFFIDTERFTTFRDAFLGFEYRKVEFLEGQGRVEQVQAFLAAERAEQRLFVWVHLFAPHEPYQAHPTHDFGDRDLDRYDSEIAFADATLGALVAAFRERRPRGVVIVTADHGEEFGEHGARYHGTSVYEEQVRVPLVISAPGAVAARSIPEPVQTIDLLPTVLGALDIPRPPRLRGRDLGPLLAGQRAPGPGLGLAETDEQALLAEGPHRLVCQRKLGACQLFDVLDDPGQTRDRGGDEAGRLREMRARLRELGASHGRYEVAGLRAEGKGWPPAILRGISGDADAAEDIAALLDDADVSIRRKAAELLFELRRPESAAALRLAVSRDEDLEVRRWAALGLTRLDQGAPLVFELARSDDPRWRRLAALALAEAGDKRGEGELLAWWRDASSRDTTRSRDLLGAFAKIRSRDAVWPLTQSLGDVRLRPYVAATLSAIGDEAARGPLAKAFAEERYQGARVALGQALVQLGAEAEMAQPLVRFLGVPDPLPGGLELALRAKILQHVGGPEEHDRRRLERDARLGVKLDLHVPRGGNGRGVRVLLRAKAEAREGMVRVGLPFEALKYDRKGILVKERKLPRIHPDHQVALAVTPGAAVELFATLPSELRARAGAPLSLVVFADGHVAVDAIALVPLAEELPPPAPEPWTPPPAEGPVPDAGTPR